MTRLGRVQQVPALVITFYYSTIGAVMTTAFALVTGGFQAPQSWGDGAMLFATGVMGLVGQMFLTKGFQLASNAGSAAMIRCALGAGRCASLCCSSGPMSLPD